MNFKAIILGLFILIGGLFYAKAQPDFTQEAGVALGSVFLFSDYGQRFDFETNSSNVGFGVGLLYYINLAYRPDSGYLERERYFDDHFKFRAELDFHTTALDFFGDDANSNSQNGLKLRAHQGLARVIETGPSLEYWPFSIRNFQYEYYRLAPFINFGAHVVYYIPDNSSILGELGTPVATFDDFLPDPSIDRASSIDIDSGVTFALVGGAGTRYKLSPLSDLVLEAQWHYYGSDWVDGLNPQLPTNTDNRANDWIFWVRLGYIYYIK